MEINFVDSTISGSVVGGAQIFLVELIKGLDNLGEDPVLLTSGTPNPKLRLLIEDIGDRVCFDLWDDSRIVDDETLDFARQINERRPDVYVVSVSPDIGWTVLPHLSPEIATVCIGHTDSDTFYDPLTHYSDFVTFAIGVSDIVCERFTSRCGMSAERVRWIPYGVEVSSVAPIPNESEPLKLLYVGRLEEHQKRVSDLVRITTELLESGIDFTLDIVGDGEESEAIRDRLRSAIDSGVVRMHGWLEGGKVIEVMRNTDVFVLTSAYEGFCISLVEAMANGCCPVVTDIESGNSQLINDKENGYLIRIGDTAGFVEVISRLVEDRKKLISLRNASWDRGKEFGIDRMVDSYRKAFLDAIEINRRIRRESNPDFQLMESCRSSYPLWARRIKARVKSLI